ncbi:MAG TPA: hypothetical protein GX504_07920 [Clostridia bacterium]|nr:hypothetical protein [Clostridia bacterium]
MKRYLTEQGITAVELLISTSLLLVLLLPFYGLLHGSLKTYHVVEARVNHQQNLRIAMEAMVKDLRQCHGLVESAGQVTLDERNLLLLNSAGEIIWYYLSGSDLRWAVKKSGHTGFEGHNPVAGGITALRFDYNTNPFHRSTRVTVRIDGVDELARFYQLSSTVTIRVDGVHGLGQR